MASKRIAALPLWYVTTAPVPTKHKQSHITYVDGGAVCGANLHGEGIAVNGPLRVKRCDKCKAWLDARRGNEFIPAGAATFDDEAA